MDICIDFDGTCVTHEFPKVGKDIGAIPVLRKIVNNGHRLILFTMRSNKVKSNGHSEEFKEVIAGNFLDDAVKWFNDNDIPLYGIQSNPTQSGWTNSPKAYGQLYIDDAGIGCPLYSDKNICKRPFVDWKSIEAYLLFSGIIK